MARDGVAVSPQLAALVARGIEGERFAVVVECARVGVSTTTSYKYVARFKARGVEGRFADSRRPISSPTHVPAAVEDLVCRECKELAEDGWDPGADSIRFPLDVYRRDPWCGRPVSSALTGHHQPDLGTPGQLAKVPQRRPRRATRRFRAEHPNGRWQIDGFQHTLCDEATTVVVVVVLQIVDECSGWTSGCGRSQRERRRGLGVLHPRGRLLRTAGTGPQ